MWDQIAAWVPGLGWTSVLVYARLQAFVLSLPGIGERVLPIRVRVAIALSLTPLLTPAMSSEPPAAPLAVLTQISGQIVIGLAGGMLLRLMTMAIDIASTSIAATASLSQIVGVENEAAPHPIGNLLHLAGIAILMALGLPQMLVRLMADSITLWPPGAWPDIATLLPDVIRVLTYSFGLAMLLAAPFTLGGFLYQSLSGVINRVMPSLPVVFIGSPLAILLALAGLAILTPMLVAIWAEAVLDFTLPRP